MRSKLVWRDLEAAVVSPEWWSAFREIKFMLICNPTLGSFFYNSYFPHWFWKPSQSFGYTSSGQECSPVTELLIKPILTLHLSFAWRGCGPGFVFGMSEELPVVSGSRRFCHKHLPRTGVWMVSSEVKQVNSNIVSHFYLCWTRILFCQVYFAPINLTRVENTNMERIKPKMSESQNLLINRHLKAEISFTYFCWCT